MIHFTNLKWRNFFSTGNTFTEIQLDKNKATCIIGKNGHGKSTLLDAMTFALFGKPFRNINKSQLINSINKKELEVQLEFMVGTNAYKIIRGIKPNIFEIYCNGEMIDQSAATKDYQKYLEENIIKINYKSFTQTSMLGKASYIPFMKLSSSARREFIEDLLDIKVFQHMNVLLKEEMSSHKEKIKKNETELEITHTKLDSQNKIISIIEKNTDGILEYLLSEIKSLNEETSKLDIEKTDLTNRKKGLILEDTSALESKISKIDNAISDLNRRYREKNKELEFYTENDSCPTCKQEISKEFKDREIEEKTDYLKKVSAVLEKAKKDLSIEKNTLDEVNTKNQKISQEKQRIEGKINQLYAVMNSNATKMTKLQKEIEDTETDKSKLVNEQILKDDIEENIKNLETEKNSLHNLHKHYLYCLNLLKDSGIKTKIIEKYIPVINELVNKYLERMDLFVAYELDEEFNEKIKSRHRDDFSYDSFSEGEKARIDLALLLTFRDISKIKSTANTSVLILDEIFDGSVEFDGINAMLSIFHEMNGVNIFVISHSETTQERIRDYIKFKKIDNYSVIVD